MLCLTRKRDEKVRVTCPDGSEIVVTILSICTSKVHIGFEAPTTHKIMREELLHADNHRKPA